MTPTYTTVCVCISSCSIDKKKLRIGVFLLIELKNASRIAVFGCTTGNILNIFFCLTGRQEPFKTAQCMYSNFGRYNT